MDTSEGLGFMSRALINIFLGILFLIPGIYLVIKEYKKKEGQEPLVQVIGIILVAIGCMIAIGFLRI